MDIEQLQFIIERFFFGWKMSVAVFDSEGCITGFWSEGKKAKNEEDTGYNGYIGKCISKLPQSFRQLYGEIIKKCGNADYPVIHTGEYGIYYLAFADGGGNLFIFGPACADALSFSQRMSYRKRYHISDQQYTVPQVALARALNGVSMLYFMLTGKTFTEDEIMRRNYVREDADASDMITYQIQNIAGEKRHNSYRDEQQWILGIENGTLDESVDDRLTPENLERLEKVGTFSAAGSLKQYEYMVVTSTALASRAAIRGGANAYDVYMQSELFLQKISQCTDMMQLLQLHMQIANEFSRMVREAKENRAEDCVEQCKDYIARYRTKKFSLSEVAKAVGRSPSYLSRLFSEQTGMTMQEYALELRLEAAANILRYSNETVGRIAEYLDFPSQSYFGERFRKKYGMSPALYRKTNKIRDFEE